MDSLWQTTVFFPTNYCWNWNTFHLVNYPISNRLTLSVNIHNTVSCFVCGAFTEIFSIVNEKNTETVPSLPAHILNMVCVTQNDFYKHIYLVSSYSLSITLSLLFWLLCSSNLFFRLLLFVSSSFCSVPTTSIHPHSALPLPVFPSLSSSHLHLFSIPHLYVCHHPSINTFNPFLLTHCSPPFLSLLSLHLLFQTLKIKGLRMFNVRCVNKAHEQAQSARIW